MTNLVLVTNERVGAFQINNSFKQVIAPLNTRQTLFVLFYIVPIINHWYHLSTAFTFSNRKYQQATRL